MLVSNNTNTINKAINPASERHKSNQLSEDDFIKILLTEMKLQTPENPFDSNTMMQQMAQLTNLSATKEMQTSIKSLNTNLETSQVLSASSLMGKKVQVVNQLSPLVEGQGLKGSVLLPKEVEQLTVTIRDMNNKVVKTIELGASEAGALDFNWDGIDAENNPLAPGFYKISATTLIDEQQIELPTAGTFNVNSVALDRNGNGVILNLEGIGGVNLKDVIKIL